MPRIALVSPGHTGKTLEAKSIASKHENVVVLEHDLDFVKDEWKDFTTIPSIKDVDAAAGDLLLIIDQNELSADDVRRLADMLRDTTISVVMCCQDLRSLPMSLRGYLEIEKPAYYKNHSLK